MVDCYEFCILGKYCIHALYAYNMEEGIGRGKYED